jgi:hypothetical protein
VAPKHDDDRGDGLPDPGELAGTRLDDFSLRWKIGGGGMGDVYLAWQESLRREVAVKVLSPRLARFEKAVERFLREGRSAAKLHHPNIVEVYAAGEHEGIHYIAMAFVDGRDLANDLTERLNRAKQLGDQTSAEGAQIERAARIVAQVAEALHYVHTAKLIHRDVKPHNILLDGADQPHLSDFGLAKDVSEWSLSVSGEFLGTPAYMSPEQLLAKRIVVDQRTDIFSLGVVLYELLTFSRPFQGTTNQEILYRIAFKAPTPVRKMNCRVPRDLALLCHKALEKDPDD